MTPNPDQPERRPIYGFAAGTPLLTADGLKRIEDIKPGGLPGRAPAARRRAELTALAGTPAGVPSIESRLPGF